MLAALQLRIARMKPIVAALILLLLSMHAQANSKPIAIAIHGGAGNLPAGSLTADQQTAYRAKLAEALDAGYAALSQGSSSLDAVIVAVEILERAPMFNAGVGAVYTWDETHELDASIMRGDTLAAGAVAGVRTVATPLRLARAVMEQSPHVMLAGRGAEAFAAQQGFRAVPNSHFNTKQRLESLRRAKAKLATAGPTATPEDRWGTVGAVALDQNGNLAAATSTGGMTAKRWGRIGDSPVIGAGTYADNRSCAVSATGHGEFFIRYNVAADICARVRYRSVSITQAANEVLFDELGPAGGTGGVIVIDPSGNVALPFNTERMYRASIDGTGTRVIGITKDEKKSAP